MAKLDNYDFRDVEPELSEFKDDVTIILNYGKYQPQVVTAVPAWRARRGEFVWLMSGVTGRLYVCTSDNSTQWTIAAAFAI